MNNILDFLMIVLFGGLSIISFGLAFTFIMSGSILPAILWIFAGITHHISAAFRIQIYFTNREIEKIKKETYELYGVRI